MLVKPNYRVTPLVTENREYFLGLHPVTSGVMNSFYADQDLTFNPSAALLSINGAVKVNKSGYIFPDNSIQSTANRWEFIRRVRANGIGVIDFTNLVKYSALRIYFEGVYGAVSSTMLINLSQDNGFNYLSSNYVTQAVTGSTTTVAGASGVTSAFVVLGASGTTLATSGSTVAHIFNFNQPGVPKHYVSQGVDNNTPLTLYAGRYTGTEPQPCNAIRITASAGGIFGFITLEGLIG